MTPLQIIETQILELQSTIQEHRELVELYKAQINILEKTKELIENRHGLEENKK
jgi:hypothetical protein